MKNTRRFISAVMALAMVSALAPMGAFASEGDPTKIKLDSTNNTGSMTATYDVSAKYTVTIPAGVALSSTDAVPASIEASGVMLESGQKIKVSLTQASNTESGATFHAKNDKGDSTATYTIGKGTATTGVKVGDVVAEFTENGTKTLTFSKAEGATYAGKHTETLTFGIEVTKAGPLTKVTSSNELEALGNSNGMKKITLNDAKQLAAAKTDETGKTCAVIYNYEPNGNIYKLYYVTNSGNDDWWMDTNIFEMYGCDELYYVNP